MRTVGALPRIDWKRCDACGICIEECPTGAVEMGVDGPIIIRPNDCTYCTACEAVCPQQAIRCPYEVIWSPKPL